MPSCSNPAETIASNAGVCPESGSTGKAVNGQTVKALLTERALRRFTPGDYRFCGDPNCDVVYFSADGARFTTTEVRVGVWQKVPAADCPVCYCFGDSEGSIRTEIEATGRSSVVGRIREHIAAGRCACEVRNPRGVCCLGDVIATVKRVESAVANEPADAGSRKGQREVR